jgi:hypothetical protein
MSNTNTGGPAFPATSGWDSQGNWCRNYADNEGMTLRDYFAAKAMQGMLASADSWINKDEVEDFATICYALADGMLKAREA